MKNVPILINPGELPHCPTPKSREFVMQLVAMGLETPQIAFCLQITPLDLKRFYGDEIEHGSALINAKVGTALLTRALSGDVVAQKFWLQTRAKWVQADKEDPREKEKGGRILEDRRKFMDDIVELVAKNKKVEEKAEVTKRATPGSKRVQ
jgi:hypothetical protein